MSSNTQIDITPVVRHEVRGHDVLPLDQLLGPNGRETLRQTLSDLAEGPDSEVVSQWERVAASDTFKTRVGSTRVELRLGGRMAEVVYQDVYSSEDSVYRSGSAEFQKAVNSEINRVLALAVSRSIHVRLKALRNVGEARMVVSRTADRGFNARTTASYRGRFDGQRTGSVRH